MNSSWTPQHSSIVGYWKLNNNSTDSSTIGTTGSDLGTVSYSSSDSKVGSHSLSLAGTGNLSMGDPVSGILDFGSGSFSVAAWFKTTTPGTWARIVGKGHSGWTDGYLLDFVNTTGSIGFGVGAAAVVANGTFYQTTATFNDGLWHYVVGVINRTSGRQALYVDGALQAVTKYSTECGTVLATKEVDISACTSLNASTSNPLTIGGYHTGGDRFTGSIDEVAIWSVPLTSTEIQSIYERQKSQYSGTFTSRIMDAKSTSSWTTLSWMPTLPFMKELPDYTGVAIQNETSTDYSSLVGSTGSSGTNDLMTGIVGLWHFNGTVGSIADGSSISDDSANGNNGTVQDSDVANTIQYVDGKLRQGIQLDGNNDYVSLPASTAYQSQDLSICLWVRPGTQNASIKTIVDHDHTGNGRWTIQAEDAQGAKKYYFAYYDGSLWQYSAGQGLIFTDHQWNYACYTKSGATVTGYLNGSQSYQRINTNATIGYMGAAQLRFGSWVNGTRHFSGALDEVAIWSRALHENEIKQLYQRGASRIKYQVRTCDDNACSGESWQGPDGTSGTYFSELNNNTTPLTGAGDVKATLPSMLFSAFTTPPTNNQYFQYRTIFESDSATTALMPELKSTTVDPIHYDSSSPSIYGNNGIAFSELNAFSESLGSGDCASGVGHNLSLDKTTWKYWNGSAWVTANGTATQSNIATVIQTNASTFGTQVGKGTVYVKAYLKSSGTSKCELDNIQVGGNR